LVSAPTSAIMLMALATFISLLFSLFTQDNLSGYPSLISSHV